VLVPDMITGHMADWHPTCPVNAFIGHVDYFRVARRSGTEAPTEKTISYNKVCPRCILLLDSRS